LKISTEPNILSDVISNLGHLVWTRDVVAGKVTLLTDGFEKIYERPIEELKNNPKLIFDSIHPDDIEFKDLFSNRLLSKNFEETEFRIISATGKIKWILERKKIIKNELGEIIRIDGLQIEITDQKSEELKLVDSEATFKSLFYKHPIPMWVYDTETLNFLAVNDAAIKFYGYTHDEFFRMTVRQIRAPEDVEELLAAIRNDDFDQYSEKVWRHLKKDGTPVYVKMHSNPINFRSQKARVVLATNITKQVEAEEKTEKIYRYLERFQNAVSKSSFLALIDDTGKISFINDNLLNRVGLSSGDLIGKKWTALHSATFNVTDEQEIWNQIQNKNIWRGQRRFTQKKGHAFWVNCSIIPILNSDEEPLQFLMIADDISSLKAAEKRNRDFAIKLNNILEGVTDSIFVLDKNWLISNTNKEAERLLERNGDFLLGKNIWKIFPEDEAHKYYEFFRKAKRKKTTVQFEDFYTQKNQWFEISIYPSKDGLVVVFRDVTERKKKEEERKEMMEHLILQNKDLEEFTYITSHSLRAQIANISMLSNVIDPSGLTPGNQEIFEKIFQSSANLNTVIQDLNTILTVKNRNALLYEKVELSGIFINVLSKIPNSISSLKKFIKADFENLKSIETVRGYFETILFQLISNSLKFRSIERLPEICIQTWGDNEFAYISVTDNGIGLELEKYNAQLFQLYKIFHPGTSGKGLGLYLCRLLVEDLRGSIDIFPHTPFGIKMVFKLPVPLANPKISEASV